MLCTKVAASKNWANPGGYTSYAQAAKYELMFVPLY